MNGLNAKSSHEIFRYSPVRSPITMTRNRKWIRNFFISGISCKIRINPSKMELLECAVL
jgi:hypothetical protein